MTMQTYLYVNAFLYGLFAVWCTVKATGTAHSLGYLQLSNGGRSEYLVIYGGLQAGLAILFWLLAREPHYHRLGVMVALGLYVPIVLYRAITTVKHWPVSGLTLGTGALELLLLFAAAWLYLAQGGDAAAAVQAAVRPTVPAP
jgi:hypothetical protein